MSDHLDTDALADVLAGLGHPDHLDACATCQGALTELSAAMARVTVALAQLPDPVLPDGLEARIQAALAQESGAPLAAVAAAPPALINPAAAATITPIDVKRAGPPSWMKAAGGLSAAAALVVGVVLVASSSGSTAQRDASGSSAGIARNNTGTAYSKDATTLTGSLAALLKGNATARTADTAAGTAVNAPKATEATAEAAPQSAVSDSSGVDALAPLRGSTGLAACLASLSDPADPGVPLALDFGTFEGQPALLVLLPGTKAGSVLAFFVGPECNATDSHLLYYEKVAAP